MAKEFKRADKFVGCKGALDGKFVEFEGVLYRIVHDPFEENDALVQSEQQFEGLDRSKSDLPDTVDVGSSIEEQYNHIRDWSLSFSVDLDLLIKSYKEMYNKRKTPVQKDRFVKRKGSCVAKFYVTDKDGLIQKEIDDNGHTVFVEYDDFVLKDHMDADFGYQPIVIIEDNENENRN